MLDHHAHRARPCACGLRRAPGRSTPEYACTGSRCDAVSKRGCSLKPRTSQTRTWQYRRRPSNPTPQPTGSWPTAARLDSNSPSTEARPIGIRRSSRSTTLSATDFPSSRRPSRRADNCAGSPFPIRQADQARDGTAGNARRTRSAHPGLPGLSRVLPRSPAAPRR